MSSDSRPRRAALGDPRPVAADGIYAAIVAAAQRDAGDGALCEALEKFAERAGKNKFRHAAQIIQGRAVGRKEIDDREALRRIRGWPAARRSSAVGIVARDVAGPRGADEELTEFERRVEAIERRLRRKAYDAEVGWTISEIVFCVQTVL